MCQTLNLSHELQNDVCDTIIAYLLDYDCFFKNAMHFQKIAKHSILLIKRI